MTIRKLNCKLNFLYDGFITGINFEVYIHDDIKIPESAINKALMIAMNYLIEKMETDKQESAN